MPETDPPEVVVAVTVTKYVTFRVLVPLIVSIDSEIWQFVLSVAYPIFSDEFDLKCKERSIVFCSAPFNDVVSMFFSNEGGH